MNREIKFRGKDTKTKEWVYGYLWSEYDYQPMGFHPIRYFIRTQINSDWGLSGQEDYRVYDASIGQYVGLKDKNSKDIYEGDILRNNYPESEDAIVVFSEGGYYIEDSDGIEESIDLVYEVSEIIGNKFDNPELLKGLK